MAAAIGNRRPRLFVFFCAIILTFFAITIIILYSETRKIADTYPRSSDGLYIFGLPRAANWAIMIYSADTLILRAAIVSLVAAVAGWLVAFVKVPVEMELVSAVLGLASLGTNMAALIHSMELHSKYGVSNDPEYSAEYQDDIEWTVEGRTCTVRGLLDDGDQAGDYSTMCKNSVSFPISYKG
jgi:hypothetical protein